MTGLYKLVLGCDCAFGSNALLESYVRQHWQELEYLQVRGMVYSTRLRTIDEEMRSGDRSEVSLAREWGASYVQFEDYLDILDYPSSKGSAACLEALRSGTVCAYDGEMAVLSESAMGKRARSALCGAGLMGLGLVVSPLIGPWSALFAAAGVGVGAHGLRIDPPVKRPAERVARELDARLRIATGGVRRYLPDLAQELWG